MLKNYALRYYLPARVRISGTPHRLVECSVVVVMMVVMVVHRRAYLSTIPTITFVFYVVAGVAAVGVGVDVAGVGEERMCRITGGI